MRAGSLKAQVQIQSRAMTQGRGGDQSATWTTFLTTWASFKPLPRGEAMVSGGAQQAATLWEVRIRAPRGVPVTIAHRILWGTRVFDIKSPPADVDMNERELLFHALEGISNG